MSNSTTYPVIFASPRHDSAIPVTTAAKGVVGWSRDIGESGSPMWPPTVLIWEGHELVVSYGNLALFDGAGNRLWVRKKQPGVPATVARQLLYYQNQDLRLETVNLKNEDVVKDSIIPGATIPEVKIHQLWPRETDFFAVLFSPGQQEVPDGDDPNERLEPPETTALKNRYGTTYGDWVATYTGAPRLPPLFFPERNLMTLVTQDVVRIDMDQEKELSKFPLPLTKLIEWSADGDEVYTVTGYEGEQKVLAAFSSAGAELWRWLDRSHHDAWVLTQPPVRAAHGRVYALTDRRILAIESGRLIWEYDIPLERLITAAKDQPEKAETAPVQPAPAASLRHGSVLQDGSLLVTAGATLTLLNTEGHKRFAVKLDHDILSPPVVDAAGSIYVATATHLVQIR